MFQRGDKVWWLQNGVYSEGFVTRRTHLFKPKLVWVVYSPDPTADDLITYVAEEDLELLKKVEQS